MPKLGSAKKEKRDRQAKIATLWFKGYTNKEILDSVGCTEKELASDLKLIKTKLAPKTVKVLEYRKNKCLGKISLVQSTAWNIISSSQNDSIKLASLRVITSSQELEAKVEGVTQEKLVIGPEKEANVLLKRIYDLEQEAAQTQSQGDGHKEADTLVETPPPF